MRVSFVLPLADLGGGVRVVGVHAKALRERGHDVTVVSTPRARRGARERFARLVRGRGLTPTSPSHLDGLDIEHRVIDRYRPMTDNDLPDADVVVATWWETIEWVHRLSSEKGAKAMLIQHDESLLVDDPEPVRAARRLPMHRIAVARWLADLCREECGDSDVSLAPNGVDTSLFRAGRRERSPSASIGFLYAASATKGVDVMLDAIERVRRSTPRLRVVAFGADGPFQWLPLPGGAIFERAPSQSRIVELYSSCDAWIVPSRVEGFGLPTLEAMACGTPVVATRTGAAPELLASGAGVVVEPGDPAALASGIDRVLGLTPGDWRRMSDAARAEAQRHDWGAATLAFERALERAIEKSEAGVAT